MGDAHDLQVVIAESQQSEFIGSVWLSRGGFLTRLL